MPPTIAVVETTHAPGSAPVTEFAASPAGLADAVRSLWERDTDVAVVGSRADAVLRSCVDGDGEAVLVLRRLLDARLAGDVVIALIRDLDGGTGVPFPTITAAVRAVRDAVLPAGVGEPAESGHPRAWLRENAAEVRRAVVLADTGPIVIEEPARPHTTPPRLGEVPCGLFLAQGATTEAVLESLDALAEHVSTDASAHALATTWWRAHSPATGGLTASIVACDGAELRSRIDEARKLVGGRHPMGALHVHRPNARVHYSPEPLAHTGELCFVYPGSGCHYQGMGRELSAWFADVMVGDDVRTDNFRPHVHPARFWVDDAPQEPEGDLRPHIQGQVALGAFVSDVARTFGLRPRAFMGYSLGETASLFSSGAWVARRRMMNRVSESDLFTSRMCGVCESVRETWGLGPDDEVDWVMGVVGRAAEAVRAAFADEPRAYLLIVNTDKECVVGGERAAVQRGLAKLRTRMLSIDGVTTVHCDVAERDTAAYHALHVFDDARPPRDGARVYSCGWGRAYEVTPTSGADSILHNATRGFDYTKTVRQAYADGARVFLEMGPGNSCTRMIRQILRGRPHRAAAVCVSGRSEMETLLSALGAAAAEGVVPDLSRLYASETDRCGETS